MVAASTLYDRLGGEAAVNAAVTLFYEKVLVDERIKKFFEKSKMGHRRSKLAEFLTYALGGPVEWKGPDMRTAHMRLIKDQGLNTSHFDVVAELLVATLQELGVSEALIAEVVALVAPLRPQFAGLDETA